MFTLGDKVIATINGQDHEAVIQSERVWAVVAGQSATKHCPVDNAERAWAYLVRYTIPSIGRPGQRYVAAHSIRRKS